jgi:hypothetical protein
VSFGCVCVRMCFSNRTRRERMSTWERMGKNG